MLASVGMYGLMGYVVKQRVREFGIRLAVGATAGDVTALVLRRGAILIASGLLLGVAGFFLFYGRQSVAVPAFVIAPALLAGVGLAACYLPARKAGAVDPISILRSE